MAWLVAHRPGGPVSIGRVHGSDGTRRTGEIQFVGGQERVDENPGLRVISNWQNDANTVIGPAPVSRSIASAASIRNQGERIGQRFDGAIGFFGAQLHQTRSDSSPTPRPDSGPHRSPLSHLGLLRMPRTDRLPRWRKGSVDTR